MLTDGTHCPKQTHTSTDVEHPNFKRVYISSERLSAAHRRAPWSLGGVRNLPPVLPTR